MATQITSATGKVFNLEFLRKNSSNYHFRCNDVATVSGYISGSMPKLVACAGVSAQAIAKTIGIELPKKQGIEIRLTEQQAKQLTEYAEKEAEARENALPVEYRLQWDGNNADGDLVVMTANLEIRRVGGNTSNQVNLKVEEFMHPIQYKGEYGQLKNDYQFPYIILEKKDFDLLLAKFVAINEAKRKTKEEQDAKRAKNAAPYTGAVIEYKNGREYWDGIEQA